VQQLTKATLPIFIDQLSEEDPAIKRIVGKIGYPPFWQRQPGFQTLVKIILEQQVSLASARAAYDKLEDSVRIVTPDAILQLTDEKLRACYFSRQKTVYVKDLSRRLVEGKLELEKFPSCGDDEIREQLIQVKGIGHWTIDVYLLLALHRLNIFPIGDLALIKSMQENRLVRSSSRKETILKRASRWQPLRSAAVFLLWHAYLTKRGTTIVL
jgi:DNA-3-methyladenine glycosylase II